MTTGSPVHDFKTLILSFRPVIAIETVEEDRAADLVRRVAAELNMPVFDWSVTQGLVKLPGTQSMHGTTCPPLPSDARFFGFISSLRNSRRTSSTSTVSLLQRKASAARRSSRR